MARTVSSHSGLGLSARVNPASALKVVPACSSRRRTVALSLIAHGVQLRPPRRSDVDEDLADGVVLDGGVGLRRLLQREVVQRQPGVLTDPDGPVQHGGGDVLDALRLGGRRGGVQQHELPAGVGHHRRAHRQRQRLLVVVGVDGHRAVGRHGLDVDVGVRGGGDLDDRGHAVGRDLADLGHDVLLGVGDDVVGAGGGRQLRLLGAADGGDDGGVRPVGELDRGVADGAGAAADQHGAAGQGARPEPLRPALGDREAAVGGDERDAQRGAEVEGGDVGQRHDLSGRHDGVLLRGAVRAAVGGLPDPHPQALQRLLDAGSDRVDHPGAVLVGHLRGLDRRPGPAAASALPVGGVHPGAHDPDPDLARARARAPSRSTRRRTSGSPVRS